jgi:enterochelin esterase-like enzyme
MKKNKFILLLLMIVSTINAQPPMGKFDPKSRSPGAEPDTAWVATNKTVPSIARFETYPTPARGANTQGSYMLYLPKEYASTTKKYPVIYYFHGGNGSQRDGEWFIKKMDAAIASGKMPPVIIISVQALPIGWYCNANVGAQGVISGPIEDVLIQNLIPHIDATYRTIASYQGRGIEGWSMGGFGATRLAFKYPNTFGFASSLAGAVIDFKDEHNPQYLENTFGPATGKEAQKSEEYFNSVHPKKYAKENALLIKQNVKIRLLVGKEDWLYSSKGKLITKNFSDYLTNLGIKNEYTVLEGLGHMLPSDFDQNKAEYPLQFWIDAFKNQK